MKYNLKMLSITKINLNIVRKKSPISFRIGDFFIKNIEFIIFLMSGYNKRYSNNLNFKDRKEVYCYL